MKSREMAVFVNMGLLFICELYLRVISSSFDILIISTLSDGKVQIFKLRALSKWLKCPIMHIIW